MMHREVPGMIGWQGNRAQETPSSEEKALHFA